jgi:hypothetical protein
MAKTSEKIKIFGCAGSGLCNVTGRGLSEVMGFVFSIWAMVPSEIAKVFRTLDIPRYKGQQMLKTDYRFIAMALAVAMMGQGCAQIDKEAIGETTTVSNAKTAKAAAGIYLADTIISAPGHTGSGFYNRNNAINGVRGSGANQGSTDIFSLDNSGTSTELIVRWSGRKIKNGAGLDFVVYENSFDTTPAPARFMDLIFVEVSNDNINYCGFAPDFTGVPETTYSNDPAKWLRFAGRMPVLYNQDTNDLTAAQLFQDNDTNLEPELGGGDAFDLDQLSDSNVYNTGCSTLLRDELKTNGFTYLRLIPASRRNNADTGAAFVADAASNGPDIDGVAARYVE